MADFTSVYQGFIIIINLGLRAPTCQMGEE